MEFVTQSEFRSLASYLARFDEVFARRTFNPNEIYDVVKKLLDGGEVRVISSMSIADLKTLLLMGYSDLLEQIVSVVPKIKIKSIASNLKNQSIAKIIYDIGDYQNKLSFIELLPELKKRRWKSIIIEDSRLSEIYNKDIIRYKHQISNLITSIDNYEKKLKF